MLQTFSDWPFAPPTLTPHELATNALKRGVLSPAILEGRVDLRRAKSGARMRLVWSKDGGPSMTTPSQRGFGSRLAGHRLAGDLGGTAEIAFDPEGIAGAVDPPLIEVAASAEVMAFLRVIGGTGQ